MIKILSFLMILSGCFLIGDTPESFRIAVFLISVGGMLAWRKA